MVLPHSNSFVALAALISFMCLSLPTVSEAQSRQQAKPRASRPAVLRYGLGFVTFPQQLQLNSSDGRTIDVSSAQTGPMLSVDYEHRRGRWIYIGAAGLSYLNVRNSSQDISVQYSAGKDYLSYMANAGIHYLPASSIKLGASLWLFYNSFDLPLPTSPGITYSFDYGSPLKNFISVDLNWQIYRGWILSQSLLSPVNKDMRTGWVVNLKVRF